MAYETLAVTLAGGILEVRFNRPESANAINDRMRDELHAVWRRASAPGSEVRAIVVTGEGKAFCAGMDVKARAAADRPPAWREETDVRKAVRLTPLQWGVSQPTIVAVNGACAGGGLHFLADADIAICSTAARFVDTHVNVGYVSALETICLAQRVAFPWVLRLALLGRSEVWDASRAREIGAVTEVVEPEALLPRARELAGYILEASPAAVAATRKALWGSLYAARLDDALQDGWALVREQAGHPDAIEGPRAFAERRRPNWADSPW